MKENIIIFTSFIYIIISDQIFISFTSAGLNFIAIGNVTKSEFLPNRSEKEMESKRDKRIQRQTALRDG